MSGIAARRLALTIPSMAVLVCGLLLAGCAQTNLTPLPDLVKPPADKLLSSAQQQKAIDDLNQKKTSSQTEAIRQIEQGR